VAGHRSGRLEGESDREVGSWAGAHVGTPGRAERNGNGEDGFSGREGPLASPSQTRLARAHNTQRNSGRTGSGGLDVRAMERPRQLFASARNTEEAGSLTIIASALVDTGSRMDEVIFQEFKGTGNMEMVLDRKCADMRIWPAMNIAASGTRREELLIDAKRLEGIHFFRRALVGSKIEDATETAVARLSKTANNDEFLKLIAR